MNNVVVFVAQKIHWRGELALTLIRTVSAQVLHANEFFEPQRLPRYSSSLEIQINQCIPILSVQQSVQPFFRGTPVSYTHLRAHETRHDLVCRLLLEKKKNKKPIQHT